MQQSRAAFDKGGFVPPLSFNTKQPRGKKKHKAAFVKGRAAVLHACNKAVRLSTKAAVFHRCHSTQNNREVTKT
jgi:hypothetical protein